MMGGSWQIERKISVGHIAAAVFQAGIVLIAIGTGYLTSRDKVHDLEMEVSIQKQAVETEVANNKQALMGLQGRLDNFETNTNGSLGRVMDLLTNLRMDAATHGWGTRK